METIPVASGDWQLRRTEPEQKFVRGGEDCVDAANRAQRANPRFPGWPLYSRIICGDRSFDRCLAGYTIRLARAYARARKLNGRAVVRRVSRNNPWLKAAALDALEFVLNGQHTFGAVARAEELDIHRDTYSQLRDTVALFLLSGFDEFTGELHEQLRRVERENRRYRSTALDECFRQINRDQKEKYISAVSAESGNGQYD